MPRALLFIDPSPTAIFSLSLHDALPIYPIAFDRFESAIIGVLIHHRCAMAQSSVAIDAHDQAAVRIDRRSEEHTSELQSHSDLVCRLLLEKKKDKYVRRLVPREHPAQQS